MDIILSASVVAAFLAGVVALFAPCCITVLLPAYLASAFREKRRIARMTFVFFAGIATVLVPIGLGAASLAHLFQDYHRELYLAGGAFMVVLGILALYGKSMPFMRLSHPKAGGNPSTARSVYALGIFSGGATSCCAPVLAGAVTLAVISGAFWKAVLVSFAYVFGMVFPLFLAAYFYDRYHLEESRLIRGKIIERSVVMPITGTVRTIRVHSTNLIAGGVFVAMGLLLITLGASGNAFWAPATQGRLGGALNRASIDLLDSISVVPEWIWAIAILGVFAFFAYRVRTRPEKASEAKPEKHDDQPKKPCH